MPPTFFESHHGHLFLIGGSGFAFLLTLAIFFFTRPRRRAPEDPGVVARRELAALNGLADDGAAVARVSGILRHYVRAVFAFPPGELTTAEFCQTLKSVPEMDPQLGQATCEFLRQCDEWKFAPASPPPRPGPVALAAELVNRIETARIKDAQTQS